MSVVHLRLVLLTRQSVTVAQQDDHVDAGKCSESQLLLPCPGQGDVSDLDGDMLGARHVLSSLGTWTAVVMSQIYAG